MPYTPVSARTAPKVMEMSRISITGGRSAAGAVRVPGSVIWVISFLSCGAGAGVRPAPTGTGRTRGSVLAVGQDLLGLRLVERRLLGQHAGGDLLAGEDL